MTTFDVPVELEGELFSLTALGDGRYRVEQGDLEHPIEGRVGELLTSKQGIGEIRLFVSNLEAKPGVAFSLIRKSHLSTVEGLQNQLKIEEKGKQSGIIGASLEGGDHKVDSEHPQ